MKNLINLLLAITLLGSCQAEKGISLMDYNAINDGSSITTEAIQKAIDVAYEMGGAKVVVPAGTYLCGTILLKDNVEFHLEKGAQIVGSYYLEDYYNIDPFTDAVGQQRGNCLVGAKGATNVSITGEGTINGRGERMVFAKGERSKRPFLVRIVDCSNVKITDVCMRNSAAWTLHLFQSKEVLIDGIRLLSQSEQNGDGIDIDSSEGVTITNCDINAHDDAICFKSTSPVPTKNCKVSHCLLSSSWGAIKFGTESMGNFENIEVSHCYIYDTKGGGLKILSADGANHRNIYIHDLEMNDVEMPIFIRLGARLRTYRDAEKQSVGSMDGIRIENINIHGKRYLDWRMDPASTIFITGIPQAKINNLRIKNIDAKMYFSGTADLADREVPENERKYPEYLQFGGPSPAYGVFIRHAENVQLSNINIETVYEEQRHLVRADDVKQLVIEGISTQIDEGASVPFCFNAVDGVSLSGLKLEGRVHRQLIKADETSKHIELQE